MWLWSWVYQHAFCASDVLVITFIFTIVWLLVGGWFSLNFNGGGYALAFVLLALGGNLIVLFILQISIQNVALYFASVLCACGLSYVCALIILNVQAYVRRRKEEINNTRLSSCYTLPSRDNAFVRDRLNTVLQQVEEGEEDMRVSFSYVRRMLIRLRNAKLSLTENLEVEELSKLFALYTKKERLTTQDVNLLNEAFSRTLKLSAKHGVTVR